MMYMDIFRRIDGRIKEALCLGESWLSAGYLERVLPLVLAIGLFILNEVQVAGMYLPLTFHDEFGYLANAAFLAGYDWSHAMWNVPYYGIGFSFWLVPAYLLSPDHQWVYQIALSLNGVFHAAAFLVSIQVLRGMFPRARFEVLVFAGLVVAMYPAFQVYEKTALGESLVLLLVWILAWVLQIALRSQRQTGRLLVCTILGLVSGYAYIVHGRAVVLVTAALVLLLFLTWRRRIGGLCVVAFVAGLFAVVMGLGALKAELVHELYGSPDYNQHDLMSLASNRLRAALTMDGALRLLMLVMGQFGYLSTSSYGLVPLGFFLAFRKILESRSTLRKAKPVSAIPAASSNASEVSDSVLLLYAVLVLIGSFAVTALFTSNPSRLDNYFYGRYAEPFAAPLMSIAVVLLLSSQQKSFGKVIAYVSSFAVGAALAVVVWKNIDVIPVKAINWIQITGWFPYRSSEWGIDFWRVIEETSIAVGLVAVGSILHRYVGIIILAIIFWNVSSENLNNQLQRGKFGIQADLAVIREFEPALKEAARICFYKGGSGSYIPTKDAVQLMVPAAKVIGIDKSREVSTARCDALINDDRFDADVPDRWSLVGSGGRHVELWLAPELYDPSTVSSSGAGSGAAQEASRILIRTPQDADNRVTNIFRAGAWYAKYQMLPGNDLMLPEFEVSVENLGESVSRPDAKLGVFITRPGDGGWVGEYRVDLPSLQPGQGTLVKVPLRLQSRSGTLLPSGKYVVHVALIDRTGWHWGTKVRKVVELQ